MIKKDIILDMKIEIGLLDMKFEAGIYLLYNRSQGTRDYFNQELLTPRCTIILSKVNTIGPKRPRIISIKNYRRFEKNGKFWS